MYWKSCGLTLNSVVVNTWLTANPPPPNPPTGGTIDASLGAKAWEHARRRAEDGAVILRYEQSFETKTRSPVGCVRMLTPP